MAPTYVPVNPEVLSWAMTESGLNVYTLAEELRVSGGKIQAWLDGTEQPNKTNFTQLAKSLGRPESFFFLARPPRVEPVLAQYRRHPSHILPRELSRKEFGHLRTAQNVQKMYKWLSDTLQIEHPAIPVALKKNSPEHVAKNLRKWLPWSTEEQQRLNDYAVRKTLRSHLEAKGIITLHFSVPEGGFRGFSMPDPVAPIIATATTDDVRAQYFSYIHELAHLTLSDESICLTSDEAAVETWCNRVAGAFLLPREPVRTFTIEELGLQVVEEFRQVQRIANRFRVSLRATAARLEHIGLGRQGLYPMVDAIAKRKKRSGGGSGPPQTRSRRRIQTYGHRYVTHLVDAVDGGKLPPSEVTDVLNISRSDLRELRALVAEDLEG